MLPLQGADSLAEAYIFINFKPAMLALPMLTAYTEAEAAKYVPPIERPKNYWELLIRELKADN